MKKKQRGQKTKFERRMQRRAARSTTVRSFRDGRQDAIGFPYDDIMAIKRAEAAERRRMMSEKLRAHALLIAAGKTL